MTEKEGLKNFVQLHIDTLTDTKPEDVPNIVDKMENYLNEKPEVKQELMEFLNNDQKDTESVKDYVNLNKHLHEIYKDINVVKGTKEVKAAHSSTFALPTITQMFGILPMFSGKPERLPQEIKKLMEKDQSERKSEEQNKIDKLLESMFTIQEQKDYTGGISNVKKTGIALICDNKIVKAEAELSEKQIENREGLLSYIKKTYGAEGLRHLLAILIGMEEHGRTGTFKFSLNDHLERLGYTKGQSGSYKYEVKQAASEIVYILCNLHISIIKKKGNQKYNIKALRFFNLEGTGTDLEKGQIIDKEFYITATEWYKQAFTSNSNESPKYTKLLKEMVHENHFKHPITIYLTTLLSIFWRMNHELEMGVKNLMEWCDLDTKSNHRVYHLRDLENELDYMKERGYIGDWKNKYSEQKPSECESPFECVLILYPPKWLKKFLLEAEVKNEKLLPLNLPFNQEEDKNLLMSKEMFKGIQEKSGLTIKEFSEKLEISSRMFHHIRNGDKKVSQKVFNKLQEQFSELLSS